MHAIDDLLKRIGVESANTMTNEDFQQWQVDRYNESIGDLNIEDGIECIKCHNKGWIQFIENGYVKTYRCECMKKRNLVIRAKKSGLGEYLKKTIDDYEAKENWQKENKLKMFNFLKEHAEDQTWFMALGTSGSGKTLLCSIIANHLLYKLGKNVLYITWTDFISKLKRDMMGDQTNEVSNYLEEIKNVEVLFLDELIKKYNETDLKYLIEIINYRYTNNLKTIITSERLLDELLDIDEATFGRAVEKCDGYLINTPKDRSKNYRLRALK